MRTSDLDYPLPADLIATRPCEPRDACRLMVVSRTDESMIEHARFTDLPRFLNPGDAMVFNTSRVLPARLIGRRKDTGGSVEGLYLADTPDGTGDWRVLLKSNGTLRPGQIIVLGSPGAEAEIELIARDSEGREGGGGWIVRPRSPGSAMDILARVGATPLPPYILRQRRATDGDAIADALDRDWYQTVYARNDESGSVAAPTAGLHFTPDLLARIERLGVARVDIRLDVGVGTFKPIEADRVEDHPMHAEWARISAPALASLASARRVVAVGTTSVRALESVPSPSPVSGWGGWTDLMIAPGHAFKRVDALVTNFHLPRSTLLLLVGALFSDGIERVKRLYALAVAEGYRFYSYGDAMLVLP